jgi:hypothetical protein
VRGGQPAATGLITTQFCTAVFAPAPADPALTTVGARAYCSPIKL